MNANNYDIDDILRIADQAVQDERSELGQFWRKDAREQFTRAVATLMAMLNTHPMPEEARRAIVETAEIAIVEGFGLGQTIGWDIAERWAPIQRTLKPTSDRVKKQLKAIEARYKKIWAFCEKRKWPYDMPELPSRLADELGSPDGKKRTRATLRKLYDRDLIKLARDKTT